MKVFLCLAAILMAGASASTLPRLSASPKVDMAKFMVNPTIMIHTDKIRHLAENFESMSPRKQIEDINDFVDMVIAEVRRFLVDYGFDPMDLPSIDESVEVAGTPVHVKLNDGVVFNASSIYRDGDVLLSYENRLLVVEVPIFFKVFKMNYAYNFAVGEEGDNATLLDGRLNAEVVVVDVNFAVQVDFRALEITLKTFNIPNMGAININFDGGMVEWVAQALTEWVTTHLKTEVVAVVEAVCSFTLKSIFDIINKVLGSMKP